MAKQRPLNPRQKLFCRLYASESEFFGSGVDSYIEAYKIDTSKQNYYANAAVCASKLLKKVNILLEIDKWLSKEGLNDSFIDKQLKFLITQHSDFRTKLGAIAEYNKLKARIIKKIDHTTKGKELPTPIYGSKSTKV